MKYGTGSRVMLIENRKYNNGDNLNVGSQGTVLKVYHLAKFYLVKFDNAQIPRRVSEIFLS
jgi:hypothetical protein